MNRYLLCVVFALSSCAIPRPSRDFSLLRRGIEGEEIEFASSQDLFVAGLVTEGLTFLKAGRLYDAELRLRQARYIEPENNRIAFNTAVVINQNGQSEEALEIIRRLLARDPQNPNYLRAEGDILAAKGEHQQAKEKLKQAFTIFRAAGNIPRAAVLARSIANLAFGTGNEQEALCYSYEALTLVPNPSQVALHARLLLALNLYPQVEELVKTRSVTSGEPLTYHALAMARYALGNYQGAIEAEDNALSRLAQAPELSQEVSAAWWLMRVRVPLASESDAFKEKMTQMREDVIQYSSKQPFDLISWPASLRQELVNESRIKR